MGDAGSNPALRCSLRTASRRSRRHDLNFLLPRRRPGPSWEAEGNCRSGSSSASPDWAPAFAGEGKRKRNKKTRRMPVGLHGTRVRVPPCRKACSSVVEQSMSGPHLVAVNKFQAGECRRDYIWLWPKGLAVRIRVSRQPSSPAPEQSGECRVGLHLATMALPKGPSHVFLVAGTTTRWRMPVGLHHA